MQTVLVVMLTVAERVIEAWPSVEHLVVVWPGIRVEDRVGFPYVCVAPVVQVVFQPWKVL